MTKITKGVIGILLVFILVSGYFIFRSDIFSSSTEEMNGVQVADADNETSFVWGQGVLSEAQRLGEEFGLGFENTPLFSHVDPDFSFHYPSEFSIGTIPASLGGKVILVQSVDKKLGFQIQLTPFDEENIHLTPERIREDLPAMEIVDPRPVLIGTDGKGTAFLSQKGSVRELWFVYRNYLFQITSPLSSEPILQSVLSTWQFE